MAQNPEHQHHTGKNNIVLVGVAGVGKTTLGKLAAETLGMLFVDGDMGVEAVEGADIDTLIDRYGEAGFDNRLLACFSEMISRCNHTIFAASVRITHYKKFWQVVRLNGTSIHLRGKPMEVYMRQDGWIKGRKLTNDEKLKKRWKQDFYDYYYWRLKYCQKRTTQLELWATSKLMRKTFVERSQKSGSKQFRKEWPQLVKCPYTPKEIAIKRRTGNNLGRDWDGYCRTLLSSRSPQKQKVT